MSKPMTAREIAAKAESMKVPELSEIMPLVDGLDTTAERRRILATKCLPQTIGWTITRKAAYAEVTTKTWYNAEKSEKFRNLCIEFIQHRIGADLPELWATYIQLALGGDRQALERVFQQVGVLDKPDKGSIDVNLTGQISVAAAAEKQVENLKQKIGAVEEAETEEEVDSRGQR